MKKTENEKKKDGRRVGKGREWQRERRMRAEGNERDKCDKGRER